MPETAQDGTHVQRYRMNMFAEIAAAIVLSMAALLTSWAGFQATLWEGKQAAAYSRAGAARVRAGQLATESGQSQAVDLVIFTQWLNAFAEKNHDLEAYYRAHFRPEFAKAFKAWVALNPRQNPSAPPTPFAMRDYVPELTRRALAMDRRADALFEEGQRANAISDAFVQATVILALALFTGGIGQTFRGPHIRLALNVLAATACLFGLIQLLSLPALHLG